MLKRNVEKLQISLFLNPLKITLFQLFSKGIYQSVWQWEAAKPSLKDYCVSRMRFFTSFPYIFPLSQHSAWIPNCNYRLFSTQVIQSFFFFLTTTASSKETTAEPTVIIQHRSERMFDSVIPILLESQHACDSTPAGHRHHMPWLSIHKKSRTPTATSCKGISFLCNMILYSC